MRGHASAAVTLYGAAQESGNVVREEKGTFWAQTRPTGKRSIFASFGLAAEEYEFITRCSSALPCDTLRMNGIDYFVTSAEREALSWYKILAARVTISSCRRGNTEFFGVLTEKYAANNDEEAYRSDERTVILVTPKLAMLREGDEVEIDAKSVYIVRLSHDLDPYKNEYEIWGRRDI